MTTTARSKTSFRQTSGTGSGGPASRDLLDKYQVGTLRHLGNLYRQDKGDWSNMLGPTHLNEGFGAFRYQIGYGAFALGLAHFHRLPAAPGLFKPTFDRMIQKMLEPDVWWYWHDASKGGGLAETPMGEGWIDPVVKDNIMYSAYLQTMTLIYNMLFNDDKYTKPGALTFEFDPTFWGPQGGFRFEYDQNTLNERVYWMMVENGYLGVACEPYCVFQICNQVPIIGFRINDALTGGSVASEVTSGYLKAWDDFGGVLDANGDYNMYVAKHINEVVPSAGAGSDAWVSMLMHSWNGDFVEANYERQRDKWLINHDDGTISVKLADEGPMSEEAMIPLIGAGEFAWVAALASEMSDDETLRGMMAYADKHFSPRFQNGGFTYGRNDRVFDEHGNWVLSTPIQANAILPIARLNVPDGFRELFAAPWGRENFAHYTEPALTEVDFSLDVYRAVYIPEDRTLRFDVAAYETGVSGAVVLSRVFDRGEWELRRNGTLIASGDNTALAQSSRQAGVEQVGKTLRLSISTHDVAEFVMTWSA